MANPKSDRARMEALATLYEDKARALRLALAELDGHLTEQKTARHAAVLQTAIALDRTRADGHRYTTRLKAQRAKSLTFLGAFDTATPRTQAEAGVAGDRRIGGLVRRGYLKKTKGGGYVRTAKVFTP